MLKLELSPAGLISVQGTDISLRVGVPQLNGRDLEIERVEVLEADNDHVIARYWAKQPAGLSLFLDIWHKTPGLGCYLSVDGLPVGMDLDSFGLRFGEVRNLRAYLRNGYHSWDGSYYVQPENLPAELTEREKLERGFVFTQLLAKSGSQHLVLGFDRLDNCQTTFQVDTRAFPSALTISVLWDRKEPGPRGVEWPRLRIFECEEVEEGLRTWAQLAAKEAQPGPRANSEPITGWCSWYNLYAMITPENLREHLSAAADAARQHQLRMRVFQIDDGFTPEMGDWLEFKPNFPDGIKPLLDEIRAEGFTPGLWIAPFLVGNRSHLYAEHPDWVVTDRATGGPLVIMRFYGEFRWHKRSEEYYLLDGTHPGAIDYLSKVFRTWRYEWGCEYFKTDFMFYGADYGPDRAIYHQPGKSRIEIWRGVAELIREEIGDALWMGCGCPLWASVGLVDAVRIGRDVGVDWGGNQSAESLLRDMATRNFANHLLWQADPDSVLLRERFHHLTAAEQEALAIYAGMSGGVTTTSDDLSELSSAQMELWKLLLSGVGTGCRFPLLGNSELNYDLSADGKSCAARPANPLVVQVRENSLFVLNPGEKPAEFRMDLPVLGIEKPAAVREWRAGEVEERDLIIAPHSGRLFFIGSEEDGL